MIDEEPYTLDNAPRLFEVFGASFVNDRINPHVKHCIFVIAQMPDGDKCEYVEVSESRTTPQAVVAFADFSDGVRLWIAEGDLEATAMDVWDNRRAVSREDREKLERFKVKYPQITR